MPEETICTVEMHPEYKADLTRLCNIADKRASNGEQYDDIIKEIMALDPKYIGTT